MNQDNGYVDMSSYDIKISGYEKNIEEIEFKNQESKQFWLRQEGFMVNLSEERNCQLEELNILSKQITIMQQKNIKIEYLIGNEKKNDDKINKKIEDLHKRLLRTNKMINNKNELRENLKDKNYLTKDEYEKILKNDEIELIKLKNTIKNLIDEKNYLNDKLYESHCNYLSWEKKLKIACETSKTIKNERLSGGDVAIMKCEIHKMEIRLLQLKKAQEKMIRDMEFCVTRRETIINIAIAKEIKNPKELHNKRVMFNKRMDDRKKKIKQIIKVNFNIKKY